MLGTVNPRTGLLEDAKLDVATRDAASGRKIFVDAMVTRESPAAVLSYGFGGQQPLKPKIYTKPIR